MSAYDVFSYAKHIILLLHYNFSLSLGATFFGGEISHQSLFCCRSLLLFDFPLAVVAV